MFLFFYVQSCQPGKSEEEEEVAHLNTPAADKPEAEAEPV